MLMSRTLHAHDLFFFLNSECTGVIITAANDAGGGGMSQMSQQVMRFFFSFAFSAQSCVPEERLLGELSLSSLGRE